MYQMIQ